MPRFLIVAVALSALVGAAGIAREAAYFGDGSAAVRRIEQDLGRQLSERALALDTLAKRIARQGDLVAAADSSPDALPVLFAVLGAPVADGASLASVTVWVPAGPASPHKVIAWSDGPAEDVPEELLTRAPAKLVLPGAGGLRLVSVQPIEADGRRVGVAVAESVISPPSVADDFTPTYDMPTTMGPVAVGPIGARGATPSEALRLTLPTGIEPPLLEVTVTAAQIHAARLRLRWRVLLVAALPWAVVAWIGAWRLQAVRRRASNGWPWLAWSMAAAIAVSIPAVGLLELARHTGLPSHWIRLGEALWALAVAAVVPAAAWWRPQPDPVASRGRARWFMEHATGSAAVIAGLGAVNRLWESQLNPATIEKWQVPVLASDSATLAALAAMLLAQVAIAWAVAGALGFLGVRWRMSPRTLKAWAAAAIWIGPALWLSRHPETGLALSFAGAVSVALALAAFGLLALRLRAQYRRASEARRLLMAFSSLLIPVVVSYPLAAAAADRAARFLVERDYAPATAALQQPDALLASLKAVQAEIDGLAGIEALLAPRPDGAVSTHAAFTMWSQTDLSRRRLTSEVELYAADRTLVSHFSLNVPEYQTREQTWQGAGCDWSVFAEIARFVAGQPRMLHAERGLCGADGTFLGAIVVRLVADYRALPFVTSANPYSDVLGAPQPVPGSRIADLQVVVYGWSLQPTFASDRVAWEIDDALDRHLSQTRDPLWVERQARARRFQVYFLSDRAGVYAVGYPVPTPLQHATRLSEAAAILAGAFVAYLLAGAALAPLMRHRPSGLRKLFRDVRVSFYRKLFLFFIVAAVGPVVLFAVAFGSYMSTRLRTNVETEAAEVVGVARRVFDELSAAQARPGEARPDPSDDVMVWIRQVVDQDVNLFKGPQLVATSQRDLFDSGLLPTRTPAAVYREVVLRRRPVHVGEDRIGAFRYLVAAAPIPALGRDVVLSVPLASRQREIEREIDELTRGVLAGAVVVIFFAAALGASVAARVSDPVARLTRATRLIAEGRLDERLVADSADELGRLVADFNTMTEMLASQRSALARAHQLQAWAEMSRQVAHDVKNPLTPIQLAAEHLARVHDDRGRPLGPTFDQCVSTILLQVRLLRRIASEFSTYAAEPVLKIEDVDLPTLIAEVLAPYRPGLSATIALVVDAPPPLPPVRGDRTQLARALTNLIENALQAMPSGGRLQIGAAAAHGVVTLDVSDTGVGMDDEAVRRAFEPYFSTKASGSGLGLANAKRTVERCGGTIAVTSEPGRGTTITMTLPAARPAAPATA